MLLIPKTGDARALSLCPLFVTCFDDYPLGAGGFASHDPGQ